MSWGATAFTPIVTYNAPPFGFHEQINPTDYDRCNKDPYVGTELLKDNLQNKFDEDEEDNYSTKYNVWPSRELCSARELCSSREYFGRDFVSQNKLAFVAVAVAVAVWYKFSRK